MQKWQEKGQRCTKIPIFIDFLPVQHDVHNSFYSIDSIFMPPDRMILSLNFAHDFVLMYYGSSSSVVILRQFLKGLCLFVNLEYRKCAVFPHFSPSYFEILSWNFAYDFVLMNYRSSSSIVTLRQFLKELCLFMNLEYRKCEVFHTFLLHALRYWAEILLWYTTDQVQVLSLCIRLALRQCINFLHLPPILGWKF